MTGLEHLTKEESPSKVILIGEGAKILKYERGESFMKIYKKYDTLKNKQYNLLAKEYIEKNDIKCRYYGFMGMAGDNDLVYIDGKVYKFNIDTQELQRRCALIGYSITDY